MKKNRQQMILKIITDYNIATQDVLRDMLQKEGYIVTQATLSRDIAELNIKKTAVGKGNFKYIAESVGHGEQETNYSIKPDKILREAVKYFDRAINLIVIKSHPGMGGAVGAAVDMLDLPGFVGSVAGDDTVLVVARTEDDAIEIQAILGGSV